MKTRAFCLSGLAAVALLLAGQPALRAAPPAVHEFAAVEQFLNLTDVELDQLQQVIVRLRALSPAERTALRQEIVRYRSLPDEQRQHLRQGWGWTDPERQRQWREMMQQATPERRAEIQARLQSLPPAERLAYRRQVLDEHLRTRAPGK